MRDTTVVQRGRMVDRDLAGRGIKDLRTLEAMREVPREAFVPESLREFAYEDSPLPIEEGQTISQPYIVALMVQALELKGGEVILDVGTGSGYAAAVLSRIASSVYSIERHEALCEQARHRFEVLGYDNIEVRHGDGTLGWKEHAPYDAIVVAAGGPDVPQPLLQQLKQGGRLVVPIGETMNEQRLVRVVRQSPERFESQSLGSVRFVPLVGEAGWHPIEPDSLEGHPASPGGAGTGMAVEHLIRETVEPLESIEEADLGGLLERISGARVVLLGEATHGTSEFYEMRARITRELIEHHGFRIVAVEADWPDAARVDGFVRHRPRDKEPDWSAFSRFPRWMWRNEEFRTFAGWLHAYNEDRDPVDRVAFYGLDLYSMYRSIGAVVDYLDEVDPAAASIARQRYGCLSPWERDPAVYGRAALTGSYRTCETEVVRILQDLLGRRLEYAVRDGESLLDAVQNARLVADAERYYRVMYYGARESWNLRDQHMFDTLMAVLEFGGADSRAIVWAHNSHVGNAVATEMGTRGEHNVGQLCREKFGDDAVLVGFGTDHGTVAAASNWDGPVEIKQVRPAHSDSYEALFHAAGLEAFLLHLRHPTREEVRSELESARLQRAIGVVYRPETELQSHYFQASLPWQFDEYIWFDRTKAVKPLAGPDRLVPLN
ncbi:MAG: protein-L-isoaspartate(D-aspartate) O-methyltransferase [Gemmatimonadota bacterium]